MSSSPEADFGTFFDLTFHEVVGFVAATTGDREGAQDAAQEAFARAYARWEYVGVLDRPDRWVLRTAARCAVDAWRRRKREVGLDHTTATSSQGDELEQIWARFEIARLTPMERAMVLLRYRDGLDTAAVGLALGRSRETVRTYLQRVRRRLTERTQGE